MIYFQLFLHFLKIGAVSFGGGYGMISLIRETVLKNNWLTESEFMTLIAVSESTPGPLAVNMATFIGAAQGNILGSFLATLGVILPAFLIILGIAAWVKNLLKYAGVKAFLAAVRPCIAALILATAIIMGLKVFCGVEYITDSLQFHGGKIMIFLILSAIGLFINKTKQKSVSPILMILLSACLGIAVNLL